MPLEAEVKKGETVEKALRRLKKKLLTNKVLENARQRYFTKPSLKKYLKKKELAFNDYLRNKRERY